MATPAKINVESTTNIVAVLPLSVFFIININYFQPKLTWCISAVILNVVPVAGIV